MANMAEKVNELMELIKNNRNIKLYHVKKERKVHETKYIII